MTAYARNKRILDLIRYDRAEGIYTMTSSDTIETPSLQDQTLRMSYRIARGEQGVLSFEPYKSAILPLWRFRNPAVARQSSSDLEQRFKVYEAAGDFVGMDMTRKFIQMGMTRSMRYARHKGGRKYAKTKDGERGEELAVSEDHKDKQEKLEASQIFRECWTSVKEREAYKSAKTEFLKEQKAWDAKTQAKTDGPRRTRSTTKDKD